MSTTFWHILALDIYVWHYFKSVQLMPTQIFFFLLFFSMASARVDTADPKDMLLNNELLKAHTILAGDHVDRRSNPPWEHRVAAKLVGEQISACVRCSYSRLGDPDTYCRQESFEGAFGHWWCHAVSAPIFCQQLVLRCRTDMIPLAGGEQVTLSSYGRKWLDVLIDE